MPQISLYVDGATFKKVENVAKRQHVSISKWVSEQIRSKLKPIYPIGFEYLFGSIAADDLSARIKAALEMIQFESMETCQQDTEYCSVHNLR